MSHRRWRQIVAPGVSPGLGREKNDKPSKRATEIPVAPAGLCRFLGIAFPGLTPRPINLSPANAGSWSGSDFVSPNQRRLTYFIGLSVFFLFISFASTS